jgi:peroxiredoxin
MPKPPKKIINRKLWIILGGILLANLIVWGIITYGNIFLKRGSNQSPYRKMVTAPALLPHFEIKNSDGVVFSPKALDAKLNVIIFFTLKDCPGCLFEAEFWSEASRMFSEDNVKFFGVTCERDREAISMFCDEYGILFPIIQDREQIIEKKILSIGSIAKLNLITPFKIYVYNNEIIHVEGAKKIEEEQREFPVRVIELYYKIR